MPAVNLQLLLSSEHVRIFRKHCVRYVIANQIFTISVWRKELVNADGLYRTIVAVEMAVNGTLEQFGEHYDSFRTPADFFEEYRFVVAKIVIVDRPEYEEKRVCLYGLSYSKFVSISMYRSYFSCAAVDSEFTKNLIIVPIA